MSISGVSGVRRTRGASGAGARPRARHRCPLCAPLPPPAEPEAPLSYGARTPVAAASSCSSRRTHRVGDQRLRALGVDANGLGAVPLDGDHRLASIAPRHYGHPWGGVRRGGGSGHGALRLRHCLRSAAEQADWRPGLACARDALAGGWGRPARARPQARSDCGARRESAAPRCACVCLRRGRGAAVAGRGARWGRGQREVLPSPASQHTRRPLPARVGAARAQNTPRRRDARVCTPPPAQQPLSERRPARRPPAARRRLF